MANTNSAAGDIPSRSSGTLQTPQTGVSSQDEDYERHRRDLDLDDPSPSLTTTQLHIVWRHVQHDESISLFAHAQRRAPKFCGLFKFPKKWRPKVQTKLVDFLILVEIGLEIVLCALFLLEFFSVSSHMNWMPFFQNFENRNFGNRSLVGQNSSTTSNFTHHHLHRPWGFKFCPSPNSSLIQAALSLLTATFALVLFLGKRKRSLNFIRVYMVTVLMTTVGRVTLAGVWYQCASNVALLPWTIAHLYFLEVVRMFHWLVTMEGPPTAIPSSAGAVLRGQQEQAEVTLLDPGQGHEVTPGGIEVPPITITLMPPQQ